MSDHTEVSQTIGHLLKIPYPFFHAYYKKVYEISTNFSNVYRCNICKLKLWNNKELLEHHGCLDHSMKIKKTIGRKLNLSRIKRSTSITSFKPYKDGEKIFNHKIIGASKKKLNQEWSKLNNEYSQYSEKPFLHPMYEKEWQIFYLRTLSNIIAANDDANLFDFNNPWKKYWQHRIQIYYDQDRQKIVEQIAQNCQLETLNTHPTSFSINNNLNDQTSIAKNPINFADIANCSTSPNVPKKNTTLTEISLSDISESEDSDDDHLTSKLRSTSKLNILYAKNDTELKTNLEKEQDIVTKQQTVDLAVMKTVLQYLDESQINPEDLSDDRLKIYIKFMINMKYYKKNLEK